MDFKIGMKTSEVLKAVQTNTNIPDNTKQLIFNFCKHDADGKISNCNELAMLNAWASGSEKVPMPKADEVAKEANVEGVNVRFVGDRENDLFTTFEQGAVATGDWHGENRNRQDILQDLDNDGFADQRIITNGNPFSEDGIYIEMEDKNLNGIPDNEEE